jgi:hypothetical protein
MLARYTQEKAELSGMTTSELQAYGRICRTSVLSNEPERWTRHALIVNELLDERGV